jgi:DNA-binding CsgD family transcriptional regulator
MDSVEAVDWVNGNLMRFRRRFAVCRIYSPFDESDYLQETHVAALVAVKSSSRKGIPFEAAFGTLFKKLMCEMTPNPGKASSGSNSVPSNLCVAEIDSFIIPQPDKRSEPDIEGIYQAVRGFLTCREQRVLCLALGLTYEGRMSNYEIAECLGCGESNVRDVLNRALERIRNLVRQGKIKPDDFLG